MSKLLEPKNALEQLEGVYEFVTETQLNSMSKLYMFQLVMKCALQMFASGDVSGYRYSVIRHYLNNADTFDPDAPPLDTSTLD